MIYLTGASNDLTRAAAAAGELVGLLVQPGNSLHRQIGDYPAGWAADNGCFTEAGWTVDGWWSWLERLNPAGCLFATAPDVVGDAQATIDRSAEWLPRIRALGFPAALVAQDGLEHLPVPWADFDVLFVGGSTEWKLSPPCADLMAQAKARGMHVHVGRVNSWKRLHRSALAGADTVDGTFVRFGPAVRVPEMVGWVRRLADHPPLFARSAKTPNHGGPNMAAARPGPVWA